MNGRSLADLADRLYRARAVFLDWDGCLVQSGALMPGGAQFLSVMGERTWVLSNNSTDLAPRFESLLARFGVALPSERILLAGERTIRLAATRWRGRPVHMVADPRMKAHARGLGVAIDPNGDASDIVLLLRDTRFTFTKLTRAVAALHRGARLVVSNTDATHPANNGGVEPETGALLAAIAACVDLSGVDVEVVGKPQPLMFHEALDQAGVEPEEAVMIGDNPATDIAGAEGCGIPSILLGPTVTLPDLARALATTRPETSSVVEAR